MSFAQNFGIPTEVRRVMYVILQACRSGKTITTAVLCSNPENRASGLLRNGGIYQIACRRIAEHCNHYVNTTFGPLIYCILCLVPLSCDRHMTVAPAAVSPNLIALIMHGRMLQTVKPLSHEWQSRRRLVCQRHRIHGKQLGLSRGRPPAWSLPSRELLSACTL